MAVPTVLLSLFCFPCFPFMASTLLCKTILKESNVGLLEGLFNLQCTQMLLGSIAGQQQLCNQSTEGFFLFSVCCFTCCNNLIMFRANVQNMMTELAV